METNKHAINEPEPKIIYGNGFHTRFCNKLIWGDINAPIFPKEEIKRKKVFLTFVGNIWLV